MGLKTGKQNAGALEVSTNTKESENNTKEPPLQKER